MAMTLILEGVIMVSKRRLPSFIEEALNTYRAEHRDEMRDARRPQSADAPAESA